MLKAEAALAAAARREVLLGAVASYLWEHGAARGAARAPGPTLGSPERSDLRETVSRATRSI